MRHFLAIISVHLVLIGFSQSLLPRVSSGDYVEHNYFSLSYVEEHEQPEWVFYKLTNQMISGEAKRSDNFREDPKIRSGSAQLADYKGSGLDRGHLAPAADMKLNEQSMSESFFLSNMSPQQPSFNRGKWKKLEETVRSWVSDSTDLWVITGPIFKGNQGSIGENEVTIPGFYYKVVYNPSNSSMIGFIMPNKKIEQDLKSFACKVDHVEAISGIDFFYKMEDEEERKLESTLNLDLWFE
jgi:endonuclease G